MISTDPGDAEKALETARSRIVAAAVRDHLTSRAEADTREFLTKLLERLGFSKVTVVFG